MDTRSWSPTSSAVVAAEVGEGPLRPRRPLDGRPHRGRLRARATRSGSAGLVVIGPVYTGEITAESLRYWDGLAAALRGRRRRRLRRLHRPPAEIDPAWRDSVLRFTRERICRHRDPEALVVGAARGAALAAVRGARRARARSRCRRWSSPATTRPTPAIPTRSPRPTRERLPRARLVSEAEGQSPLAWQGGRLSREIAAFCARSSAVQHYSRFAIAFRR